MADKAIGLTQSQQHQAQLNGSNAQREPIPMWDEENPEPTDDTTEENPGLHPIESDPVVSHEAPEIEDEPVAATEADTSIFNITDKEPEVGSSVHYFPSEGFGGASTINKVEEGGRMKGLDGFLDMWAMGRDLEAAAPAIIRRVEKGAILADPNYDPSTDYNLGLIHEGLTDQGKNDMTLIAAESQSEEESAWLRQRYDKEVFQQQELAKYGVPGAITQFATAALDETAWGIGMLTGGVVGAAYKLNRLKAIVAAGVLAAAENTAVEAIVMEGSVTRTQEDLIYAAGIGAVLGGGFGAIFSRNSPGTLAAKLARISEQRSLERMEEIDRAIIGDAVADAAGTGWAPIESMPEPGFAIVKLHAIQQQEMIEAAISEPGEVIARELMYTNFKALDTVDSPRAQLDASPEVKSARAELAAAQKEQAKVVEGDGEGKAVAREAVEAADDKVDEAYAAALTRKADESTAKAAEQKVLDDAEAARDYDAELKAVDEKLAARAKRDGEADAPVDHTKAIDAADEIEGEMAFIKSVRSGVEVVSEKLRIRADQDWLKSSRQLLVHLRDVAPDKHAEITGGKNNPTLEEFEDMMLPAINAIRKAVKGEADALAGKAKVLDELATKKQELLDAKQAQKDKAELDAAPKVVATGGHAGAAGVNRTGEFGQVDLDNMTPEMADMIHEYPESVFIRLGGRNQSSTFKGAPRIRFDLHSTSQAGPEKGQAVLGDLIGEESTGKKGHATSQVSASEIGTINGNAEEALMTRVYFPAQKLWMEEMNIPKWERWRPKHQKKFAEAVTDQKEFGGSNSPNVVKAANGMIDAINRTAHRARKWGVEGYSGKDFDIEDSYVTRIHDQNKIQDKQQQFGQEAMIDLVIEGIKKAQPFIDDDLAIRIGKGYVRNVSLRGAGVKGQYHDLGIDSIEYVESILRDIGINDADTDAFVKAMMRNTNEVQKANTLASAKKRLFMDIDVTKKYNDLDTGVAVDFSLKELFVRDARTLTQHYIRSVGGMAAVAERTFGTPMYIRSRHDFDRLQSTIAKKFYDAGGRKRNIAFNSAQRATKMMFDRTTATPLYDPDNWGTIASRKIKNYNVARLMGQVAFAQMSEQGTMMSTVGVEAYLKAMPEMGHMWKRAVDGTLDNETLAILEDWTGLAVDRMNGRIQTRFDASDGEILGMVGGAGDEVMHAINRRVLEPMQLLLEFQQRTGALAYTQRLTDNAMGVKLLGKSELKRLRAVGLGPAELKLVQAQMEKHSFIPKGSKIHNPNLKDWDDDKAIDAFRYGISRTMRRAVQENSIGTTSSMSNHPLGSLITQFRGFMMVAAAKQLGHGMHMRDVKTAQNFIMASIMASIGWAAQTQFKAQFRPDKDEYLKKKLTWENAMKAGIQRSAWATMMPSVVDNALRFTGNNTQFDYRSSSLNNSSLESIPSVDAWNKAYDGAQGLVDSAFHDDRQVSRSDMNNIRYALPAANMWATTHAWNYAVGLFPESKKQK